MSLKAGLTYDDGPQKNPTASELLAGLDSHIPHRVLKHVAREHHAAVAALMPKVLQERTRYNAGRQAQAEVFNRRLTFPPFELNLLPLDPESVRHVARARAILEIDDDAKKIATARALSVPLISQFWQQLLPRLIEYLTQIQPSGALLPQESEQKAIQDLYIVLSEGVSHVAVNRADEVSLLHGMRKQVQDWPGHEWLKLTGEEREDAQSAYRVSATRRHAHGYERRQRIVERISDFRELESVFAAGVNTQFGIVIRLAEVIRLLLVEEGTFSPERYAKILRSRSFKNLMKPLIHNTVPALVAASLVLSDQEKKNDVTQPLASFYAPRHFVINNDDEVSFKPESARAIHEHYKRMQAAPHYIPHDGVSRTDAVGAPNVVTGCPAKDAVVQLPQDKQTSVINAFTDFIVEHVVLGKILPALLSF